MTAAKFDPLVLEEINRNATSFILAVLRGESCDCDMWLSVNSPSTCCCFPSYNFLCFWPHTALESRVLFLASCLGFRPALFPPPTETNERLCCYDLCIDLCIMDVVFCVKAYRPGTQKNWRWKDWPHSAVVLRGLLSGNVAARLCGMLEPMGPRLALSQQKSTHLCEPIGRRMCFLREQTFLSFTFYLLYHFEFP
jgi:hypothetical protein